MADFRSPSDRDSWNAAHPLFPQKGKEAGLREALILVDDVIFDLPIGEDVAYSRGYSAGIAAARQGFRDAILAALSPVKEKEPR